ncbi:MAG: flagellar motor switch protein FliG [Pseudomonadota bacterium]
MSESEGLEGAEMAAIFLLTVGEEGASEVLRHVSAQEMQKVGQAMADLSKVSNEQVEEVMSKFADEVKERTSLGIGNDQYLLAVLTKAVGSEKAKALVERIIQGRDTKGLEALKWMEPRAVAEILKPEHPQIVAIVLSHLKEDMAAAVLKLFDEEAHVDVLTRIAQLNGVQQTAIIELDEIIEKQVAATSDSGSSDVGGMRSAANIIGKMGGELEESILEKMKDIDEEFGVKLQELLFVFESLLDIDDRGIQALLREVPTDKLGVALKGADPAVQDKIFTNMSSRAAEIMQEDMEVRGPVKLSDVEEAQKEILTIAQRLAEEGKIDLGGSGDEYV